MWQGNPDTSGARSIGRTGDFTRLAGEACAARASWTDEVLMAAVAAHDDYAFAVLYDRYVDLVYSASLRVLADTQLAEDATQDVFVRIWRRPETFIAQRGRFLSWLMSVARNRAVDELRARGRRRRREGSSLGTPEDGAQPLFPGESDDPLLAAQVKEEQLLVRRALVDLPVEQRIALEMAYFNGLTQQQIAVSLHEPLGTVKTRIRLGMQKLRRAIEPSVRA